MTERRENIARALWSDDVHHRPYDIRSMDDYRRLADAAIAADGLQGRVLQLAEELDGDYEIHGFEVARLIRAAVDGADSGSATT